MTKKEPPKLTQTTIPTDQSTYDIDWAQSDALEYRPRAMHQGETGVLSFLNQVETFAMLILRNYGDYEEASKECMEVAFPLGADPAAYQIRRSFSGEKIPADLDTAVELLSHVKESRRCLNDSDSAGAFYHGQMIQRYLQAPETIDVRNKIRGSIPKTEKPGKIAARDIFVQYGKEDQKITWKHLLRELESKGFMVSDKTIKNWLTEFRKDSQ